MEEISDYPTSDAMYIKEQESTDPQLEKIYEYEKEVISYEKEMISYEPSNSTNTNY